MPGVLMAQDSMGVPTFHGRRDLITFLSTLNLDAVKWREYAYGR